MPSTLVAVEGSGIRVEDVRGGGRVTRACLRLWRRVKKPQSLDDPFGLARLEAELGVGLNRIVSRCLQDRNVQEYVARAISKFYEAKPFLRIEPLDDAVKCRTTRGWLISDTLRKGWREGPLYDERGISSSSSKPRRR